MKVFLPHESLNSNYVMPPHISAPGDKLIPSHAAVLDIILAAKNASHIYAETALAEIGNIMGKNYVFVRRTAYNSPEIHEIEVRP